MKTGTGDSPRQHDSEVARTLRIIAFVVLALAIAVYAADVLLLVFAAILLAVVLGGASDALARHLALPRGAALAAILCAVVVILALTVWVLAPRIGEQSRQLMEQIPAALKQLSDRYGNWLGGDLYERATEVFENPDDGSVRQLVSGAFGAAYGTLGYLASSLLVVITAIYLAATPGIYIGGALRMVPAGSRARAESILRQAGDTLLWWTIGKLISMAVVGVLTFFGLWLLDIPLAVTLSLIAALLAFIPNFGPIISAVPALLVAFGVGVDSAIYVAALYVGVQLIESYTVTPLVQQKTVSLPPALTIIAQVVMGVFAGGMGLAMATPLAAVMLVLVRELYLKDVLEDDEKDSRSRRAARSG